MTDDTVAPGTQQSLPELEEYVEPFDAAPSSEPLAENSVITTPDEQSLRIVALLKSDAHSRLYHAILGGAEEHVWLRETCNEEGRGRLRHEAQVMEGLDCSMFPHLLACFEKEDKTYLVAEATPGETFEDALVSGQLSLSQAIALIAQVAFGLSHLHAHGWVHLGLRPAVIVSGRPVKILDFSYATRVGEKPSELFYHSGYSPPELLTEDPISVNADIYAVGALLFHAVNGQPIGEAGAELRAWQPPAPLAGVPQILWRCLGERKSRYTSMAELHRDLLCLARRITPRVSYSLAAATTIGMEPTRTTNQDAYAYLTGRLESEEGAQAWTMVCIADGMGGMAAGEVASEIAIKTVLSEAAAAFAACRAVSAEEQVEWSKQWINTANTNVCNALEARQARGGTTLVCACLVNRRLSIAHVGDSRIYLLRNDQATLLSHDHSLAMALALQDEIPMEKVRAHPDRNQVTRSLGDRQPLPDYFVDTLEQVKGKPVMELQAGDVLLLCSDGLWEPVLEEQMRSVVSNHAPNLNAAADTLLKTALQGGSSDNVTVVLLRMDETASS